MDNDTCVRIRVYDLLSLLIRPYDSLLLLDPAWVETIANAKTNDIFQLPLESLESTPSVTLQGWDCNDADDEPGVEHESSKNEKLSEKLSCPFRFRDPLHFNVRDHFQCSAPFPSVDALSRHMRTCHVPHVATCAHCLTNGSSASFADQYWRWETKRDATASTDKQLALLWSFIFPGVPQPTDFSAYVPPIDHFEVQAMFDDEIDDLMDDICGKDLDSSLRALYQHDVERYFNGAIEKCVDMAKKGQWYSRYKLMRACDDADQENTLTPTIRDSESSASEAGSGHDSAVCVRSRGSSCGGEQKSNEEVLHAVKGKIALLHSCIDEEKHASNQGPEPSSDTVSRPSSPLTEIWAGQTASASTRSTNDGHLTSILGFILRLAYGVDLERHSEDLSDCQALLEDFLERLREKLDVLPNSSVSFSDADTTTGTGSGISSTQQSSSSCSTTDSRGKKKGARTAIARALDEEGAQEPERRPSRPEPKVPRQRNLRLSCPYRKRFPGIFNVREHYSCSMTYYTEFAKLRQHIAIKHRRGGFLCGRCGDDFPNRGELLAHQQQAASCPLRPPKPECGIDEDTVQRLLLAQRRRPAASDHEEWRDICHIVFPTDNEDIPSEYRVVVEHFELKDLFLQSLQDFMAQLTGHMDATVVEDLIGRFRAHFLSVLEACNENSERIPYENDQSRRSGPTSQGPRARERRSAQTTPSTSSGSTLGGSSTSSEHSSDRSRGGRRRAAPGSGHRRMLAIQENAPIAAPLPLQSDALPSQNTTSQMTGHWHAESHNAAIAEPRLANNSGWINSTQVQPFALPTEQNQLPFFAFLSTSNDNDGTGGLLNQSYLASQIVNDNQGPMEATWDQEQSFQEGFQLDVNSRGPGWPDAGDNVHEP